MCALRLARQATPLSVLVDRQRQRPSFPSRAGTSQIPSGSDVGPPRIEDEPPQELARRVLYPTVKTDVPGDEGRDLQQTGARAPSFQRPQPTFASDYTGSL